jgi:hypothetical protein
VSAESLRAGHGQLLGFIREFIDILHASIHVVRSCICQITYRWSSCLCAVLFWEVLCVEPAGWSVTADESVSYYASMHIRVVRYVYIHIGMFFVCCSFFFGSVLC